MASITSAAVTIPSFTGLKATTTTASIKPSIRLAGPHPKLSVKSSLKDIGAAVVTTAASALLAANALALDVGLGTDDGALVFNPAKAEVASGEKITFINVAGFPHNVIFDEDGIPAGVDVADISMKEDELLNAPGETYSVTLTEKGSYSFYCGPHQGAGMVGNITVK